ncbi:MAG: acyl carrier protein [Acidimicrobiales bacterium]
MAVSPESVRLRLAALLRLPADDVPAHADLADLITDSLTVIETALELQDEFDVILHQHDLGHVRTVADLTTLVAERAAATRPVP